MSDLTKRLRERKSFDRARGMTTAPTEIELEAADRIDALEEIERLVTDNGKLNAALNNARSMFAAGCSYTKDGDPELFCGNIEEFFSALSANVESADSSDEIERLKHDLTRATETGAEPATRAERAEAALAECRAKLEVDPRTKYDGIACRDETIRLQDEEIERLKKDRDEWKKDATTALGKINEEHIRANNAEYALAEAERKCERLKFHAGGMAYCCEALEMALTKAASIYANRVTLNIDDFLPLTKAYAAYRAEFKEDKP